MCVEAVVWPSRAVVEPLTAGAVHVWAASLDVSPERLKLLSSALSRDERERSMRFGNPGLRRHFVAARGLLREIVGRYLTIEPSRVGFVYGPHGKPALERGGTHWPLQFSLSHAGSLALYALSLRTRVGVDVEAVLPSDDLADIAERFFSPSESAELSGVSPERRALAFYGCWTRKEAYLKARGVGLQVPLSDVEVSVVPADSARLLAVGGDVDLARRWTLVHLRPADAYVGAVAVEMRDPTVKCGRWVC